MSSGTRLAFDLGASSGRAILGRIVNGKLELEEIHRFPNHPVEKDGRMYWDFSGLMHEIETGLVKACAACPNIASVSVDTWGVDIVFFRGGKPVREPYCYRDPRFERAMNSVHEIIPAEEMFRRTGIQIMPFNTVYQLYADREDAPEDFRGTKILFMPDAILAMLTGNIQAEYTDASTGALLDPVTRDWNWPLLDQLGIPTDILPELAAPCTSAGLLSEDLCRRLGIPRIPAVRCGSHDTASAVAAMPSADAGNAAYISLGTWALLGAEIPECVCTDEAFRAHYTNEGALEGKIRFLTNITGTWLLQETRRVWNEAGGNLSFGEMSAMAESAQTEKRIAPNDPAFSTPGDMPGRIENYCVKTGQGAFSGRAELLRCIYESIADCFCDSLRKLENLLGVKYQALHVLGGGSRDRLLMRLTAERTGIPILAGPVEATAVGNLSAQFAADGELNGERDIRALSAASFPLEKYLP